MSLRSLTSALQSSPPPHRPCPALRPPRTRVVDPLTLHDISPPQRRLDPASIFNADGDELQPHGRTRGVAVAPADRSRARASSASRVSPASASVSTTSPYSRGAGDEIVLPVAAGAGAPPAGAEPACQLPAEPASRERRRFGSSYARTGMERVWPLCVECQSTGRGTVALSVRFF